MPDIDIVVAEFELSDITAVFESDEFGVLPYQNVEEFSVELLVEQGPAGPKGDKGDKGEPGDVGGSLPWANVTGKPDLIEDSEIIDGGNF